jgi:hypothetical protein
MTRENRTKSTYHCDVTSCDTTHESEYGNLPLDWVQIGGKHFCLDHSDFLRWLVDKVYIPSIGPRVTSEDYIIALFAFGADIADIRLLLDRLEKEVPDYSQTVDDVNDDDDEEDD